LYAAGLSMGSGMILNYLIEEGDKTPLTACFILSCFYDSQKALEYFKTSLFGIYDKLLASIFKK
jgi:predicted alpha/beta-fold hydrolase